jgi:glycerol-3-phosphate cytidylyltransferase
MNLENKGKIGVIAGSFDLIHPGYIRMFKEAKENACDWLVVLLQDDPTIDRPSKCKPVQSWDERKEVLESIRYIDDVWYYNSEESLYRLLDNNKHYIHVRILGNDYINKKFTGDDLGIPVYFCERNHDYSLTDLKHKIFLSLQKRSI